MLPDVMEICSSEEDSSGDDDSAILQPKILRVHMNTRQAIEDSKCLVFSAVLEKLVKAVVGQKCSKCGRDVM